MCDIRRYTPIIRHFFPHLSKFWLKLFDLRYLNKEVENFFLTMIKKIIKLRENTPENRNDLLDLLLTLRTKSTDGCIDLNGNEIQESENSKNDTGNYHASFCSAEFFYE